MRSAINGAGVVLCLIAGQAAAQTVPQHDYARLKDPFVVTEGDTKSIREGSHDLWDLFAHFTMPGDIFSNCTLSYSDKNGSKMLMISMLDNENLELAFYLENWGLVTGKTYRATYQVTGFAQEASKLFMSSSDAGVIDIRDTAKLDGQLRQQKSLIVNAPKQRMEYVLEGVDVGLDYLTHCVRRYRSAP